MHNPIILVFLSPATSGEKANGDMKEAVVPNCVHNLPETRKVKPRLAETNSLQFGVVSGMHVQAKFCTWNANGAQPLQEHRAQENRIFQ